MNENNVKELNCKKCNNIIEVEQDVIKVTCSICCATIGMKKEKK